jgi:excisionase family DNA binding protein
MLTTDEVAERYKIDKQTQARYRRDLGLPYIRPGKRILYPKAELEAWLDRHRPAKGWPDIYEGEHNAS